MKPTIATHVLFGALGLFGSTVASAQEPVGTTTMLRSVGGGRIVYDAAAETATR